MPYRTSVRGYVSACFSKITHAAQKPATIYLLSALFNRLSAIILVPFYTRKLTLAEYGDYALALTLSTILSLIFSLALARAVSRFYFEGNDRDAALARSGSVARWATVIDLMWTLSCVGIAMIVAPAAVRGIGGRHAMLCVVAAAAGLALQGIPIVMLQAVQRPYIVAALQTIDFLASAGFGLLFVVVMHRGFAGSVEALAASGALSGGIAAIFIWGYLPGRLDPKILPVAVKFSAPFLLQFLANWVQSAGDRWGLKIAGKDFDVGRMGLAVQVTQPVGMPAIALADADFARVGEVSRTGGLGAVGDDLRSTRLRYAVVTVLPALLVVAAIPVLRWILGAAAASGTIGLVPILCAITIIDTQFYPHQFVVYYASRSRWMVLVAISTAATNIGLMALLVPRFGIYGAVSARGAATLARSGTMWFAARACLRAPRQRPAD
jgi:O-antigen/teichoic acid export membrane protein